MNNNSKRRRRQRNTGSLREIARGKWQLRYRGESDIAFAATKTDAAERLHEFVERVRNGGIGSAERLKFKDLAALCIASKERSKRPTTIIWYERNLKQHVIPAIGEIRLQDLKAIHVQRMIDNAKDTSKRKSKGNRLGATSLRNLLILARAILAWGVKQGMLRENVASKVDLPRAEHVERLDLTRESALAILIAAQGHKLFAIIATAIWTGARRGELCALRWSDLNLEEATIAIRRAAANVNKTIVVGDTKTKNSRRTDHLPAFLVRLLQEHRKDQLARFEKLFTEMDARRRVKEGYVFTTPLGAIWDPNELSRQFARFIRSTNLPHFRLHDLRHGYANLSSAAGVPLAVVSKSLGHASIGITADIYTHLLADQKREKAATLDAYFSGSLKPDTTGESHA